MLASSAAPVLHGLPLERPKKGVGQFSRRPPGEYHHGQRFLSGVGQKERAIGPRVARKGRRCPHPKFLTVRPLNLGSPGHRARIRVPTSIIHSNVRIGIVDPGPGIVAGLRVVAPNTRALISPIAYRHAVKHPPAAGTRLVDLYARSNCRRPTNRSRWRCNHGVPSALLQGDNFAGLDNLAIRGLGSRPARHEHGEPSQRGDGLERSRAHQLPTREHVRFAEAWREYDLTRLCPYLIRPRGQRRCGGIPHLRSTLAAA